MIKKKLLTLAIASALMLTATVQPVQAAEAYTYRNVESAFWLNQPDSFFEGDQVKQDKSMVNSVGENVTIPILAVDEGNKYQTLIDVVALGQALGYNFVSTYNSETGKVTGCYIHDFFGVRMNTQLYRWSKDGINTPAANMDIWGKTMTVYQNKVWIPIEVAMQAFDCLSTENGIARMEDVYGSLDSEKFEVATIGGHRLDLCKETIETITAKLGQPTKVKTDDYGESNYTFKTLNARVVVTTNKFDRISRFILIGDDIIYGGFNNNTEKWNVQTMVNSFNGNEKYWYDRSSGASFAVGLQGLNGSIIAEIASKRVYLISVAMGHTDKDKIGKMYPITVDLANIDN